MAEKKVWGSQPGKERGSKSRAEDLYLRAAQRALAEGVTDANNPSKSIADCPPYLSDDMRNYWRDGFRKARA
jgi:ribosome modulation factor